MIQMFVNPILPIPPRPRRRLLDWFEGLDSPGFDVNKNHYAIIDQMNCVECLESLADNSKENGHSFLSSRLSPSDWFQPCQSKSLAYTMLKKGLKIFSACRLFILSNFLYKSSAPAISKLIWVVDTQSEILSARDQRSVSGGSHKCDSCRILYIPLAEVMEIDSRIVRSISRW